MRHKLSTCAVTILAVLAAGEASAQSATPEAPATDVSRKGGDLSDKLNDTGGVIHPQGSVDPKMQKAPPATGNMPVIPPPGTPGGPSGVEPK